MKTPKSGVIFIKYTSPVHSWILKNTLPYLQQQIWYTYQYSRGREVNALWRRRFLQCWECYDNAYDIQVPRLQDYPWVESGFEGSGIYDDYQKDKLSVFWWEVLRPAGSLRRAWGKWLHTRTRKEAHGMSLSTAMTGRVRMRLYECGDDGTVFRRGGTTWDSCR